MGWTARRWFPSNFLLLFRFVVCFWLEKAYKKWKAIKAVQMGIKRTKRWGGKKRKKSAVSRKRSQDWQSSKTTAASRQIWNHGDDGDDKHFEGLCLPEKCIWTNLQIQLYKFQNVFEELRLYTEERGLHIIAIPELRNYVNARSFSFWNSVIQCSGYSDILIPLTRIVDKYNG